MLKIGLISDTHSHLDPKVLEVFADVDEIWHAGDIGNIEVCKKLSAIKPVYAVYGNIDGKEIREQYPYHLILEREGFKVLFVHIGGYPGNYDARAIKLIEEHRPNIFVCGHSHILRVVKDERYNNMIVMNPGAAGIEGFHKLKTLLRFTLDNGKITNMDAVELGKRGKLV
jgi:putative phosphoesterase